MHSLHGEGKLTFHDFLGTVTKGNGLSWLKVLFKKKKGANGTWLVLGATEQK